MARIKRKTGDLLVLPLLVGAPLYSAITGEWWLFAAVVGAATVGSLVIPVDRQYGEATSSTLSQFVLALEHLLGLGLLGLFLSRAPSILDGSAVAVIVWIALVSGLVAYFVRAALAWRRFRHEGAPG